MTSNDIQEPDFDLAVSFAGEQRDFVREVVKGIGLPEGRVFFDEDFKAEMWGEDLVEFFTGVYSRRARFVVMFISREYKEKEWTRLERRSALSRAIRERGAYILPVMMDSTKLDEVQGMLDTIGYVEAAREGIGGIVQLLKKKVVSSGKVKHRVEVVANSQEGIQAILSEKPVAWEYLAYASVINTRWATLAERLRDLELGYAPTRNDRVQSMTELHSLIRESLDDYNLAVEQFNTVLSTEAMEAAMGSPGSEGDPDRILHMANRFMDSADRILSIAEKIRGTRSTPEYRPAIDLLARLADQPISGIRDFIEEFIPLVNSLPERLLSGENVYVSLVVKIEIDEELSMKLVSIVEQLWEEDQTS